MSALETAAALIAEGVPIFTARPNPAYVPGAKVVEFRYPTAWQDTKADPSALDKYQPGHMLGIVCGHGVDVVDVDTKHGADIETERQALQVNGVVIVGEARTPSGGAHFYVPSVGICSTSNTTRGVDFRGAGIDGTGTGFVFAPGTQRPKYDGRGYEWITGPDVSAAREVTVEDQRDGLWTYLQSRGIKPRLTETPPATTVGGEPVELESLPESLAERLATLDTGDRSGHFYKTVALAKLAGYTQGQAVTLMTPWCEAVGKYVGRVPGEVARVWSKVPEPPTPTPPAEPMDLEHAHDVFRTHLGNEYDLDAMTAVVATAAVNDLDGDPVWILVVSGSGDSKTETVSALGNHAIITSTITSEGALLSATSRKEKAADASGGLLRVVGESGVIVLKDFTSILSMGREVRASVLAALREVYDGKWERNVGTDGGRTLNWEGRIVVIGACTTAWDSAHAVVSSMGDRFAVIRLDSSAGRRAKGRQALANVGSEATMRAELRLAVAGVLAGMRPELATLTEDDTEELLAAADLVTWARTATERDHQGNIVDAHALEAPTRFAKGIGQIMRGALAIGVARERALQLALRVAADSMPPLRLAVLADVANNPSSRTSDVRSRMQKPRTTIDRVLQELHILGLLEQTKHDDGWHYDLAADVEAEAVNRLVTRNVSREAHSTSEGVTRNVSREVHPSWMPSSYVWCTSSDKTGYGFDSDTDAATVDAIVEQLEVG